MDDVILGAEDFRLNKSELSSPDSVITSLFMNLFKINNNDAIEYFNVILILKTRCTIRAKWTLKFDSKFVTWDDAFCKLT